jgi:hypothetical protein
MRKCSVLTRTGSCQPTCLHGSTPRPSASCYHQKRAATNPALSCSVQCFAAQAFLLFFLPPTCWKPSLAAGAATAAAAEAGRGAAWPLEVGALHKDTTGTYKRKASQVRRHMLTIWLQLTNISELSKAPGCSSCQTATNDKIYNGVTQAAGRKWYTSLTLWQQGQRLRLPWAQLQLPWVHLLLLGAGSGPGWRHSWASRLHRPAHHTQVGFRASGPIHQVHHASKENILCALNAQQLPTTTTDLPPLPDLTGCTKCMRAPRGPHLWGPGVRHQQHLPTGLQGAGQQGSHPGRRVGHQQGALRGQARAVRALLPWLCRAGAAQSPSGPQPHRPPGKGQPAGPG